MLSRSSLVLLFLAILLATSCDDDEPLPGAIEAPEGESVERTEERPEGDPQGDSTEDSRPSAGGSRGGGTSAGPTRVPAGRLLAPNRLSQATEESREDWARDVERRAEGADVTPDDAPGDPEPGEGDPWEIPEVLKQLAILACVGLLGSEGVLPPSATPMCTEIIDSMGGAIEQLVQACSDGFTDECKQALFEVGACAATGGAVCTGAAEGLTPQFNPLEAPDLVGPFGTTQGGEIGEQQPIPNTGE